MFKIGQKVNHYLLGDGEIIDVDNKSFMAKIIWVKCPSFVYNGGVNPCWIGFNYLDIVNDFQDEDSGEDDDIIESNASFFKGF